MENSKLNKLIIIGSGPAGYSALIYAARANLDPMMFTGQQPGGQLTITTDVENYPGYVNIKGPELMEEMKKQALHCGGKIINENVLDVDFTAKPFKVITNKNTYYTESVIISTGAQAKWLGIESEAKFMGYGVSGCATCDGFFYKNQTVAVIGGGNSAVEEALYLTNHAKKVILIHRRDKLKCEKILEDRLMKNDKIEIIWNSQLKEIIGTEAPIKSVNGIIIKNLIDNSEKTIDLNGVFVAIGHSPNTKIFINKIDIDNEGYIITQKGSTKTNVEGVFAAGDVQDKIYKQAVVAAGFGCMAALDALSYLES